MSTPSDTDSHQEEPSHAENMADPPTDPMFTPCTNRDLLVISRRTNHHPSYRMGACLDVLDHSEIEKVECDRETPKRCDKNYQLLLGWKLKMKTPMKAVWAPLLQCLKSLEDEGLICYVEQYLQKISNPVNGM